ncbi:DUF3046 domain-containing protein [Microbacterium gubbeenense]|uniref:DUF3046 domain-containing protein n=1 Tax=Microbacterium gubbeenense TaxID=159896 RepID=UPI00048AB50A|nr:DUF3046 domain-containing protein [Microbacterium gubbeenense]
MRRSEFLRAVDEYFGARATWVLADLVLPGIGLTASAAIDSGVPPREVWVALCAEADLPEAARYGAGLKPPRA